MTFLTSGFRSPYLLVGLFLLFPVGFFLYGALTRQRKNALRLGVTLKKTSLGFSEFCLLLSLMSMIIGIARPYDGTEKIALKIEGIKRMILFDVSRSMLAQDVRPSRIELGKRKVKDLLKLLERGARRDLIGITLFSGSSYLFCPLTEDVQVVSQFADSISTDLVTSLGSNLIEALKETSKELSDSPGARILLVSDGEDETQKSSNTLGGVSSVPVDILGMGTTGGGTIPLGRGYVTDEHGDIVTTVLAEEQLSELARDSGGSYERARLDNKDLEKILAHEPTKIQFESGDTEITVYHEIGGWFGLAALCFYLLPFLSKVHIRTSKASALIFTLGFALSSDASPYDAYRAYRDGRFADAVVAYESELKSDPENPKLLQGYASSLFKTGKFKDAQKIFDSLASQTQDPQKAFENRYNEGNSKLQTKDLDGAIKAYDQALAHNPHDERVLHNRAIAKKLLEQKPTLTPTPTPTPSVSPSSSTSPSPNPTPSAAPSASPQKSGTPTPNGNGNKSDQGTPTAMPSKSSDEEKTPTPQSSQEKSQEQPEPKPAPTPDAKKLKEEQAQAWLDSIPEAPLLIARERKQQPPKNGRTW